LGLACVHTSADNAVHMNRNHRECKSFDSKQSMGCFYADGQHCKWQAESVKHVTINMAEKKQRKRDRERERERKR